MADVSFLDDIHELSDLELAVLLCLISKEHCLISTPTQSIDDLITELQLVAERTFGLEWTVINCNENTTLHDFASALSHSAVVPTKRPQPQHLNPYFSTTSKLKSRSFDTDSVLTGPHLANFVVARNLDRASQEVQIQALELLRTRRIFTRTSVLIAPKQFVFIPVLEADSGGDAHLTPHLNDFLSIAHWHDPEDGFVNLEEIGPEAASDMGDDAASTSSSVIVKKSSNSNLNPANARITQDDVTTLREKARSVQIDIDVTRYQMNIVSFLRMHRAVDQGITPAATRYFDQLIRNLAPLHKLDYVTPALVCLAARKVYLHRIRIAKPEEERSMQWGSSLDAVQSILEDVGPEEVIDQVLEMVTAPV